MLITVALFIASIAGWMNAGGQCAIAAGQRAYDDKPGLDLTYLRIRRALIFAALMGGAAIFRLTQ